MELPKTFAAVAASVGLSFRPATQGYPSVYIYYMV